LSVGETEATRLRRERRRARAVAPLPPAVTLHSLQKRFGTKQAVAGVDLEIPARTFFGIVGPNGAGKTTTLRMATGLLRPDRGSAIVDGIDVWADPVSAKRRMGVLPEQLQLFDRLAASELLTYVGLLRGMDEPTVVARGHELLDTLGLREAAGVAVADFSQGMRKKIGLACALLHAPRVLFLDEPFESVDPVSARVLRSVLQQFVDAGGTVVLSSHVMDTVEKLCQHVAVFHAGRVVATGRTGELRGDRDLEEVFAELVGADEGRAIGLEWLSSSSA
jgi:ABC-2 type transport system ATP-binding protein